MVDSAREQIKELLCAAHAKAVSAGELPEAQLQGSSVVSKEDIEGDWAANHALASAKSLKMAPRRAAEILVENLNFEGSFFEKAEVAGPGFINFMLSDIWYGAVMDAVRDCGADYGRSNFGAGEKVMIEFVSANPTGPMTIGNARGGVLGDTLAEVMRWSGFDVKREFYINDEGNQVELFGRSIEARYLQLCLGEDAVEFPEDGYHGDDIRELAALIRAADGDIYIDMPQDERRRAFVSFALPYNIQKMREHLERYRIEFDTWFPESELHKSGYVDDTVNLLVKEGCTYESEGALWLRNTDFGADKDEVLRRANGFFTYYAADIAYHRNKFEVRGFDRVIDVLGADHHGHSIRFNATMSSPQLGLAGRRLDFLIMQMVRMTRSGELVKVSKRTGKAITLNELLDEISVDACRFFFNAKPDTHLEFDLDLAVRQDSENPVYYVQYAHARICTMLSQLTEEGYGVLGDADAAVLAELQERELIKQLALLPEEIILAARDYDPSRINRYLIELAARFHKFYNACRIRGSELEIANARMFLVDCTRQALANALGIIGVTAPEKM